MEESFKIFRGQIDQDVAKTVEAILLDIEARGWSAIRAYSEKFDGWKLSIQ